jgi:hypothetical protein
MTSEAEKESSSLLCNLYRQMYYWRKSLFLECLNSMRMPIQTRLRSIIIRELINEDKSGATMMVHEEETSVHPICSVLAPLSTEIPDNIPTMTIKMPIPEISNDSTIVELSSLTTTNTLESSSTTSEMCGSSTESKVSSQVHHGTALSLSLSRITLTCYWTSLFREKI